MLVRSLLIAVFLISSSLAQSALAELPQFIPVDVPNHVYDGGWEHFVGGGVAVFDCNGDSKPDLVAAGGTNLPILLRNTSRVAGEVSFVAATPKNLDLKGTTGVYPIDANNDGLLDLMVLRVGSDILLHGAGDCTFSPAPLEIGDHWSTTFSATWEANQIKPTFAFGHYVDQANAEGPFEACDTNIIMRPTASGYSLIKLNPGYCALSMLFTDWARKVRPTCVFPMIDIIMFTKERNSFGKWLTRLNFIAKQKAGSAICFGEWVLLREIWTETVGTRSSLVPWEIND